MRESLYAITCMNCNAIFIGETKRVLETCIKEYKEDIDKLYSPYTATIRKKYDSEMYKSAITYRITQHNHIADWEGVMCVAIASD